MNPGLISVASIDRGPYFLDFEGWENPEMIGLYRSDTGVVEEAAKVPTKARYFGSGPTVSRDHRSFLYSAMTSGDLMLFENFH